MPLSKIPAFRSLLSAFVFFTVGMLAAQTLQRRPSTEPQSPAGQAPASDIDAETKQTTTTDEKPVLPQGTTLQVEITRHYPMKAGESVEATLLHPIYFGGKLAVPAQTTLHGEVVALEPDRKTRWQGRLHGDFTPFHTVEMRFNELMLPGGPLQISSTTAANGAPVLSLSAPGIAPNRSFIAREFVQVVGQLRDRIAFFTSPGLGDRGLQLLYRQLPYHPERIEANTAWSFELTAPLEWPNLAVNLPEPVPPVASSNNLEAWSIRAQLSADLTSATAKPGDPVAALVVEPVWDRNRQLVVPQGSTLIGKVTTAKAARSLGRNGKLRFTFQEIHFPEGARRQVEGSLAGATTQKTQNLSLDAEGTVTPRNQASAIAPILLTLLAGRALDQDGDLVAHTAVASNGFGFIGRIVGVAAGNYNLAAGIGFYAAGLSVYENFLHSGHDVVFPKDTRIEIETTPLRAPVLKPDGQ